MQFIFLISAKKRAAKTRDQEREKPGREFVTFILICNIAVWGLSEHKKMPKLNQIKST